SSQPSPVSCTPSPQLARLQVVRQASGAMSLLWAPWSHCSIPASTMPSPHTAGWHCEVQLSVSTWLPSSQTSPVSMTPSPQPACLQVLRQASGTVLLLAAPSSQSSTPASTKPSPQLATLQPVTQPSVSERFPSSQPSPVSLTESPQRGLVQVVRQALGV